MDAAKERVKIEGSLLHRRPALWIEKVAAL